MSFDTLATSHPVSKPLHRNQLVHHKLRRCADLNQTLSHMKKETNSTKKEKSHIQNSRGKAQLVIYRAKFSLIFV